MSGIFRGQLPRTAAGERFPDLISQPEWTRLVTSLRLTRREQDVLRFAFLDERYEKIAERLGLKGSTIHTYCDRLFLKLGCRSLTQAMSITVASHLELAAAGARPRADRANYVPNVDLERKNDPTAIGDVGDIVDTRSSRRIR